MFDLIERSRFGGRPVQLFVFTRQALIWRYCSADRDMVIGGHTYFAATIERSEIQQTVERAKDKLTIKVAYLRNPFALEFPSTQSLGDNWHPYAPSDEIRVICLTTHWGDTDAPKVEWMGVVTQPDFTDTELTLTCEPGNAIGRALNQGAKFQKGCWKTVYSTGLRGCNLAPDAFKVDAVLSAAAGVTLTAAAFSSAPLSLRGGWVEWTRGDGLVERRSIMDHAGSTLWLQYGAAGLVPGLAVVARPGCPQTWAACDERDNTDNFGGAMFKPSKNPTEESMSWD